MFLTTLTDVTINAVLKSVLEEMFAQIKYSDSWSCSLCVSRLEASQQCAELESLENIFVIYFSLVEDL